MKQDAATTHDDPDRLDLEDGVRQRIRALRAERGWSLDELAERCHLGPSTLSRIETGHRRLALDHLVSIAQALGVTVDDLLGGGDDPDDIVIQNLAAAGLKGFDVASPAEVLVARQPEQRRKPLGRIEATEGPLADLLVSGGIVHGIIVR